MYLHTPLAPEDYKYMRMPLALFPEHTVAQYDLQRKAKGGYVYVEIRRAIYGLPQAGALANKLLKKRLAPFGYYKVAHTPGLWKHVSRPVAFSLVVDDFGVKYQRKADIRHLLTALRENYMVATDWEGSKYAGINLDWDYKRIEVHLSMPEYCRDAMEQA